MSTCGVIRTYHKTYCKKICFCNEKEGIQLKEEYFQNAGKIEGIYRKYYNNGQTSEESNYINGKREGIYRKYHNNGQLDEEVNYINGKREGNYRKYYNNGQLHEESNYINGKREGISKSYYASGNIENESNYNNNILNGEYKSYSDDINRQIIKKLNYVNGSQEGSQIYYKNDEDYVELLYINDKISSFKTYGNKIADIDVILKKPIECELLREFLSENYLEQYNIYF